MFKKKEPEKDLFEIRVIEHIDQHGESTLQFILYILGERRLMTYPREGKLKDIKGGDSFKYNP